MRGPDRQTGSLFSYVSPEGLVPQENPLRGYIQRGSLFADNAAALHVDLQICTSMPTPPREASPSAESEWAASFPATVRERAMRSVRVGVGLAVVMALVAGEASAQPWSAEQSRGLIASVASQAVERTRPIALACACEARSQRWCQLAVERIQTDAHQWAARYTATEILKAYADATLLAAIGTSYRSAAVQVSEDRDNACAVGRSWRSGLNAWDDALLNNTPAPGSR